MRNSGKILTIAHRGASGEYPENTLLSFRRALEVGADWIECDIQAAHGDLFILHDPTLDRVAGVSKTLAQLTKDSILSIDVGLGEPIPTFDQVAHLVKGKAGLNLELKGFFDITHLTKKLQALLGDGWNQDTLLVSSFNHPLLSELKSSLPTLPVAPIFYEYPLSGMDTVERLQATTVCMDKKLVIAERVAEFSKNGIRSFVFTLNTEEEVEKMISFGVSGIITNFPQLALRYAQKVG